MKIPFVTFIIFCFSLNSLAQVEKEPAYENKSKLYIIRSNARVKWPFFMDGNIIGKISNQNYSFHEVSPGKHTFAVEFSGRKLRRKTKRLELTLEPGQSYYIEVDLVEGLFLNELICKEITESAFKAHLSRFELNKSGNKNKNNLEEKEAGRDPLSTDTIIAKEIPKQEIPKDSIPKFRISLYGGWGYHTARVVAPDAFKQYTRQLKSGYYVGSEAICFFSKTLGAGIRSSIFNSRNSFNGTISIIDDVTGAPRYGLLKNNITIRYIAPSFCMRSMSEDNKLHLITSISIGYLDYRNEATVVDSYTITGNTIGGSLAYELDYMFSKQFAIGISLSRIFGNLYDYEYDDGKQKTIIKFDEGKREGLSRIDIGIGLKWNR